MLDVAGGLLTTKKGGDIPLELLIGLEGVRRELHPDQQVVDHQVDTLRAILQLEFCKSHTSSLVDTADTKKPPLPSKAAPVQAAGWWLFTQPARA